MRKLSKWMLATIMAASLSTGCFILGKSKNSSSSRPVASEAGHKNRGQERKEEVHERNAERKADKDAAKTAKKDQKEDDKDAKKK